jgi:hypothetical protein
MFLTLNHRDGSSQPTLEGGCSGIFGEKRRIFQFLGGATLFLMKNGRKFSDFVEQKKQFFVRLGGCSALLENTNIK